MIIFVYVVLVFLVLRFSVTVFNFLSNPKLGHYGRKFNDKVSIIITGAPSENTALLKSIEEQDYQNIEVLLAESQAHSEGLIKNANGKYLFFVDSKSIISRGLFNSLIYRVKAFDLKLIILIPNRELKGFKSWLTQPLSDYVILNLLPLRLVRILNFPSLIAANESCLFYDANSYRQKNDDLEKEADTKKVETLLSNGMLTITKRGSGDEASRELIQIFDKNIFAIVFYLLFLVLGPLVLIWNFELAFISLPLGLIFLSRVMISFLTKQNPLINVVLHPLQMAALTYLLILGSIRTLFTRGKHSRD